MRIAPPGREPRSVAASWISLFWSSLAPLLGRRDEVLEKYCDEHVCVCLSVREDISGTTNAIFAIFLCMLPMAVARSSADMMTKS